MRHPILILFNAALLLGGSAFADVPSAASRYSGAANLRAITVQANGRFALDASLQPAGFAKASTDEKQLDPVRGNTAFDFSSQPRFSMSAALHDKDAPPDAAAPCAVNDIFGNRFE